MPSGFPNGFGIIKSLTTKLVESIWINPKKIDVTHIEFEWEIPEFYPLDCLVEKEFVSPEFESYGSKWQMHLHRKQPPNDLPGPSPTWELFIGKNADASSNLWVHYTVGIKKNDGTEYKSSSGKVYLGFLSTERDNRLPFGQFFGNIHDSHCYNIGKKLIFSESDLRRYKSEIAAKNDLVVFCKFSLKEKHCERIVMRAEKRTENSDGKEVSCQSMKAMFYKQLFSDLTIKVKDEEFISHKGVLATRSPVFQAMLQNDMVEKRSGLIEILDCEPDVFREFLVYLYSGDTEELSTKRICGVYSLADKYDVPQLKLDCVAIMLNGIKVDNFCEIISLAIMHDETELLKTGTEFFLKNSKSVLQSVQWQTFLAENPTVANELFLKKVDAGEGSEK